MTFRIKSLGEVSVCLFVFIVTSMAAAHGADTAELDQVDYIKPIIGTHGTKRCGRTIRGAYVPFGMVQLSPDNRTGRGSTNGYNYRESTIEGFSFNHMSGVGWHGTLGNFQIMPTTGKTKFHSGSNAYDLYESKDAGWKSKCSHENEVAKAGYYSVLLDTYDILTELTCTLTGKTYPLWQMMGPSRSQRGSGKSNRPPSVSRGTFPDAVKWAR